MEYYLRRALAVLAMSPQIIFMLGVIGLIIVAFILYALYFFLLGLTGGELPSDSINNK